MIMLLQLYCGIFKSQNNLFKHFQEYLGIFTDTDTYSATLTGIQLGGIGGIEEPLPSPF